MTNPDTNISCLALTWASKVNCLQRKGRVGRVAPGTVFRIIPKRFYEVFHVSHLYRFYEDLKIKTFWEAYYKLRINLKFYIKALPGKLFYKLFQESYFIRFSFKNHYYSIKNQIDKKHKTIQKMHHG
jgi:hypothetical protein